MSVSQRSMRSQKDYEIRKVIRTLQGGTVAIRAAGIEYLPKEPGETPESYRRRLNRSFLTNYFQRTVANLASKPFSMPVGIKSERFQELAAEYLADVDGRGTSATTLAHACTADAVAMGSTFLAGDCAVNGGRPYLYLLPGENILAARKNEDDKLIHIRILETAVVQDGQWGEKEVKRVRVFDRDGDVVTWSLYDGETDAPIVLDQPFALKEIPVTPIHAAEAIASDQLQSSPPLLDLAYMNIQHYQESSDQSNILRIARVPVLFASGVAEDAAITIGSEYAIKGEAGADLKYVEHSGAAIGAGRDSLKDLETKMESYGLGLLENSGVAQTATGHALRAGETNNRIAMLALNVANAMEIGLGWVAYFNKIADPDFQVHIDTEYGISSSTEDLTALASARTMGDLSREDYLQEMKRRGILRNEFSLADNEDRLSVELA
ncbi:DUF4055 domain-containing protein [Pseudomonas sp. TH31]|uniref:DUF4055 domain-containing protein n=1 Tax=Pseudomonas sp. TH31 TaxID=2796396 RepID=UPI001F5BF028|nr:DUF4055 domain-containing protein [Pseudomonas sp. TH31]